MAVVVGIDGGTSTSTLRAETTDGVLLAEAVGEGTNPQSLPSGLLLERFRVLLDGVPRPTSLLACISGMTGEWSRDAVGRALHELLPDCRIDLAPDYAAAMHRFAVPVGTCTIAGTGSVVCGLSPTGRLVTTGGLGPLLGERGSASALGRAAVARWLDDPSSVGAWSPELEAALGLVRSATVRGLYAAQEPARLMARAAPVVTRAAEAGDSWAVDLVEEEMACLADTLVRHLRRHEPPAHRDRVGLAGGLWTSPASIAAFRRALVERRLGTVELHTPERSAAAAAVNLARAS